MALLWHDGFTTSYHPSVIQRRYSGSESVEGSNNFVDEPYDLGLKCPLSTTDAVMHTPTLVGSPATTIICSADLRVGTENMAPYNASGFAFRNSAGEQLRLEWQQVAGWPDSNLPSDYALMEIVVKRGATTLATSTTKLVMDAENIPSYLRFEIKVVFGATGSVEVRYMRPNKPSAGFKTIEWDNSLASVDTEDQGTAGCDSVAYFHQRMSIGNWVIMDDSGADMNDFLGLVYSWRVSNNGSGALTDWGLAGGATSTQDALYEAQGNDDDDRRISSTTAGNKATCSTQNTASANKMGTNTEIKAISFGVRHKMDTGAGATGVSIVRVSSTDYDLSTTFSPVGTAYEYGYFIETASPASSSAWTVTEIEGMEVGVRHVS